MNFIKQSFIKDIYEDAAFHWLKFLETNDLWYMTKKSIKKDKEKYNIKKAEESFHKINDSIINCFGLDESYRNMLDQDVEIALLKLQYIETGQGYYETLFQIEEAKKEERKKALDTNNDEKSYNVNKEIGIISKEFGGGVMDIKNITIHQYLTAKQNLKDG